MSEMAIFFMLINNGYLSLFQLHKWTSSFDNLLLEFNISYADLHTISSSFILLCILSKNIFPSSSWITLTFIMFHFSINFLHLTLCIIYCFHAFLSLSVELIKRQLTHGNRQKNNGSFDIHDTSSTPTRAGKADVEYNRKYT